MRILIAQLNTTIGDLTGNTDKIISTLVQGQNQKADLVLFHELTITGYPPEDFLLLPHFIQAVERELKRIIAATKDIAAIVGLPRTSSTNTEKKLYNSAAVISNCELLGFQDKILLPTYDVFDEKRYFEPGNANTLWKIGDTNIGITICEDIWQHSALLKDSAYKRDPIIELSVQAPDIVLNLSASPFSSKKPSMRLDVTSKAAQTLDCPVILCNQVGGNDSLIFDGYSLYVNEVGQLCDFLPGFKEELKCVEFPSNSTVAFHAVDPAEDIFSALQLGVHDYFAKLGFKKACIGLSGGIDSAVVACVAAKALGPENVLGVSMPSRFSSPGSVADARQLASTLGINFEEIPIEGPFQSYLDLLEPHFKGLPFDLAEENLQARVRGMILMGLSNKFGYIVLTTGNKSELAVGYSTLYGDMCGGLGVLSDLTKKQVYAVAAHINKHEEIIPQATIDKPPSAELRAGQLDTDSLPDYDVLDSILDAYIVDHLAAEEIAARFNYPIDLVNQIVKMIYRNEHKRRQSPPGLRISEKAFSVGRRFPIVQGFVR